MDKDVVALIFSILSLLTFFTVIFGILFGILGLIFSIIHLSNKNKIKKGIAVFSLILSIIAIVLSVLLMFLILAGFSLFFFLSGSGFDVVSQELTDQVNHKGIPGRIEVSLFDIKYISPSGKECSYSEVINNSCKYVEPFKLDNVRYYQKGKFEIDSLRTLTTYKSNF